ncbi:MAG: carbon-nitrogen hydrolase family protein [Lachnospiraceae bacterium]|nr:carbon-nitrogen hydrolase family protein [Lachnospiraceae bacterium]
MNVCLLQTDVTFESKQLLFMDLNEKISEAKKPLDLIILPELFSASINLINLDETAEDLMGDTVHFLVDLAKSENSMVIGGIFEKDNYSYYNSAIIINRKGNILGKYRKICLNEFEMHFMKPGRKIDIFETEFGKFGVLIGNDLNSLALCEKLAASETDFIICLTQIPYEYDFILEQIALSRVMDIPCFLFMICVTGTSSVSRINFSGQTSILRYVECGEDLIKSSRDDYILAGLPKDDAGLLVYYIDLDEYQKEKEFWSGQIPHKKIHKMLCNN